MAHHSHNLKAYTGDHHKPLVFCSLCGKEESEGLDGPCSETFYEKSVDTIHSKPHSGFVSGLPDSLI